MRAQHRDVLLDAPRAGFRPLGVLNAVEDRVAVGAVERAEERARLRIGVERALEVVGDGGGPRARVGGIPSAVGFRALDLA